MKTDPKPPRPFWLDLAILVAGISLVGLLLSAIDVAPLSNTYFITAVVCLVVAVVPIFTEIGGNTRTSLQARREGKPARDAIRELEKSGKYSRGTRITFLFGLAGFMCFVLAILTL